MKFRIKSISGDKRGFFDMRRTFLSCLAYLALELFNEYKSDYSVFAYLDLFLYLRYLNGLCEQVSE